jgi:hypothetical protein
MKYNRRTKQNEKKRRKKQKNEGERSEGCGNYTRTPAVYSSKNFFFSFFLFPIFSCYLLTLEKDRREEKKGSPLSLSLSL